VVANYVTPDFLAALTGSALLLALPCLWVAVGQVRVARPDAPRWLTEQSAADLDRISELIQQRRPPTDPATTVVTGLLGGLLTLELTLVVVELFRTVVGAQAIADSIGVGGLYYEGLSMVTIVGLGAAVTAGVAASRRPVPSLNAGLLAAFIACALAAPVVPLLYYAGFCYPLTTACFTVRSWSVLYGATTDLATARTALFAVPVLLLVAILRTPAARLRRQRTAARPAARPPAFAARLAVIGILAVTTVSLGSGLWYFIEYQASQ
jgi:hypothetical protein